MTQKFLVYMLLDPDTGSVRYVGRSSSALRRPFNHFRCKRVREKRDACHAWVRAVLRRGKEPVVQVLQAVSKQSLLDECERFWIRHFQLLGEPLLNSWLVDPETLTLVRRGWRHSKLTRRKIASAKRVSRDSQRRPVVNLSTGQWHPSVHAAARAYGVSLARMSAVCNGLYGGRTVKGMSFLFFTREPG